jgi:hypothetical protein
MSGGMTMTMFSQQNQTAMCRDRVFSPNMAWNWSKDLAVRNLKPPFLDAGKVLPIRSQRIP